MNSKSLKKFTISGWYGNFNAGDDAILQVFIDQACKRWNCKIVVLSEQPENIERTNNVEGRFHLFPTYTGTLGSLLNGDFFRHARNLLESDIFVLGGGGILRDNTNWRNLVSVLDEIWISKLLGRKVMLYAIGVGPFKSRLGKLVIGMSVRMCDLITVRDAKSAKLLMDIGIPAKRIHVVADPAFLLGSAAPQDQDLVKLLSGGGKVGVFPTSNPIHGEHGSSHAIKLARAFDSLFEKTGLQFVALPMQIAETGVDDVKFSHAIKAAMKYPEAMEIYEKRLTPLELKWVTGQTLFNITVRLHAMIFSLGLRTPVVAVNYEPKVANVFASVGAPEYLIEVDGNFEENLISAAEKCLQDLPAYKDQINVSMLNNEKSALRTFELMESLCP
ncbi:MAG: polysaccharide pyruvyl transferase family protein [Pseudomonadota bacterium]